jgi:hypothetical protein
MFQTQIDSFGVEWWVSNTVSYQACTYDGYWKIEVRSRQTGASRLRKPLARLTTNGVIHVLSEKGSWIAANFRELLEVMGTIGTKSLNHIVSLRLILWDLMGSGDEDYFGTYATS